MMVADSQEFLQHCWLFDIEVNEYREICTIDADLLGKTSRSGWWAALQCLKTGGRLKIEKMDIS